MTLFAYILQDVRANKGNHKFLIVLPLFRMAQVVRKLPLPFLLIGVPYLVFYRVLVEWILAIELPWNLKVGKSLRIFHGFSLVINDKAILGDNVTLRHCVTIGHKILPDGSKTAAPTIGDNVDIGANAVVLGPITIGAHSVIGAGSVVTKDVACYSVVAGNPARLIKRNEQSSEEVA